uniref:Uncharacterized protein n=1 Tax=Kalanchoe fedtschenkoi TaxID=63787 RepID=A0A7N0TFH3_KALFE
MGGNWNQVGLNAYYCCSSDHTLLGGLTMLEKRQVFLRSYQFSRKMSVSEKMKRSLVRVKGVIWLRLRGSTRKIRKVVWSKLRRRQQTAAGRNQMGSNKKQNPCSVHHN